MRTHFSNPTATLIANSAPAFEAIAHLYAKDELLLQLEITLLDGRSIPYQILASISGTEVRARELKPRLPNFCPERHINNNGIFCLYWDGDKVIHVNDETSAIEWWETLIRFLMQQERATKLRKWPDNNFWAHGSAASFQKKTYLAAADLGQGFIDGLLFKQFEVQFFKRKNGNGSFFRVLKNGKYFYSVWVNHERVACWRQNCICDQKINKKVKPLKQCSNHAQSAVDFAVWMWEWQKAEAEFWIDHSDKVCCGTMNDCPLKKL